LETYQFLQDYYEDSNMYIHCDGIMMLQRAKRKTQKHIPFALFNAVVSPTNAKVNRFEFNEAGAA
jgi:hypothetical protein